MIVKIVLIGMMGSGKTVVGKIAAEKLGWEFIDSDTLIETKEKMSIATLFKKRGEESFRELEKKIVRSLALKNQCVIATGGGTPCFKENWSHLAKNGFVIWLKASPKKLMERLKREPQPLRPLLKGSLLTIENLTNLLVKRERFYQKADLIFEVDRLLPEQIAEKITKVVKSKITGKPK